MNGAAKIKYGIYDRFAEGRRAKAPEHGGESVFDRKRNRVGR